MHRCGSPDVMWWCCSEGVGLFSSLSPIVMLRRKEMLYLTTHSIHYLQLYGIKHMVKDHSDSERDTRWHHFINESFQLAIREFFMSSPNSTYTRCGTLGGTSNSLMDPPRRIDPMQHILSVTSTTNL